MMKKKRVVLSCLGLLVSVMIHAYEAKELPDPMSDFSDMAVRERGYHYSFCTCFAIKLKPQEVVEVLQVLEQYKGKDIPEIIKNISKQSEIAAKVLRDFGKYKRIQSVDTVISILKMPVGTPRLK